MTKNELLRRIEVKFKYLDFELYPTFTRYGLAEHYRSICELDGFILALYLVNVLNFFEYDNYVGRIDVLKDIASKKELEYY